MLIFAGCSQKEWYYEGQKYQYRWISKPNAKLLASGVCIDPDYTKYVAPNNGKTLVYSTIESQMIRSVNAKEGTISIDFIMAIRWLDPNIKTHFSRRDQRDGGIALSEWALEEIWMPDIYILNRQSFQDPAEWRSIKSSTVLASNKFNDLRTRQNKTTEIQKTAIEIRFEIKATVYCNFNHIAYPLDRQTCDVRLGSGSTGAVFVLFDSNTLYHQKKTYQAENFDLSVTFFDGRMKHGNNSIGIHVEMERIRNSFIFEYYIPCIAIVLVSELSFVIPITSIPGRVGLLITLFLTLINLFIHQMVSHIKKKNF